MNRLTHEGVEDLIPYPPGKPIEELERELGIQGSIKLASNENPLGPSPRAVQAIMDKVHSLHRYPDGSGYYLKTKLSEKFGLPIEQIILGNGSNELIELIIRTFLTQGEHVVQAFPTFLVYEKVVKGAGGTMTSVPLSNFRIDLEAVSKALQGSFENPLRADSSAKVWLSSGIFAFWVAAFGIVTPKIRFSSQIAGCPGATLRVPDWTDVTKSFPPSVRSAVV